MSSMKHRSENRPFVRLSAALSLDGKLHPMDSPGFKLGSENDRRRLLDLRRQSQAVLIGATTLRVDSDPKIVSATAQRAENPVNIVCSTRLELDLTLPFFTSGQTTRLIFTTDRASEKSVNLTAQYATVYRTDLKDGNVDLIEVMNTLSALDISSVLLEGGGKMNHSALQANLVDELHLTLCPFVLAGKTNASLFDGHGFSPGSLPRFTLVSCTPVGDELFIVFSRR